MSAFLKSLLTALESEGLTDQHIRLLMEDGYKTSSRIRRLSVMELKAMLGINGGLAADILSAAENAKDSDFQIKDTGDKIALQTLLEGLVVGSHEQRAANVKALIARGALFVVVNEHGAQVTSETMALLFSADRRVAEKARLWNDMKVVPVEDFLPDLTPLRSPYGGHALVEGVDQHSGIRWGELPQQRLGLAVWTIEQKLDAGRSHSEVFDDFCKCGPLFTRAIKLARVRDLKDEDLEALALVRSSIPTQAKTTTSNPKGAMGILLACFSEDELRCFARNSYGMEYGLPGNGASPLAIADCIVQRYLQNHGTLDASFFQALVDERPRRKQEILLVAATYGI